MPRRCFQDSMTSSPAGPANRTLTIRLPAGEARAAELAARVDGVSVNELTRRALASYVAQRCRDEQFQATARAQLEQDVALIEGRP